MAKKRKAETSPPKPLQSKNTHTLGSAKLLPSTLIMTSHWETGAHDVLSTTATPSNYLQMLTSQNAGSPHLFVGGRSHYNEPFFNPSIERRVAHFIAAC